MNEFRLIGSLDDLPVRNSRQCEVDGRVIGVFHTTEGVFAVDDTCPHRGGPLADGDLDGIAITCPWHFWTFDLRTGEHADPRIRLVTHEVRLEDGQIWVRLSDEPDRTGGSR